MSRSRGPRRGGGLLDLVDEQLRERGTELFPQLTAPPRVDLVWSRERPRGAVYRVRLRSGEAVADVLVKARRSGGLRELTAGSARPEIHPPLPMTEQERARCEYNGLRVIEDVFAGLDEGRFAVVRPLLLLPEHATVLTEFVDQPTLRSRLQRSTWPVASAGTQQGLAAALYNTGCWLRLFHGSTDRHTLTGRPFSGEDVADLLERFAQFLTARVGPLPVLDRVRRCTEQLPVHLPSSFPSAVRHGDFAPRNLFVGPRGQVAVFDPLPGWEAPVFDDLARFLVGLRPPISTLVSQRRVSAYQAAFLRGYFQDGPPPELELSVFQLLVLMDQWAGVGSGARPKDWAARGRAAARRHFLNWHYRREVERLVAELSRLLRLGHHDRRRLVPPVTRLPQGPGR